MIFLGHFLLNNINVLYQDHYKININVYSLIKCYGKIRYRSINDVYISIGANSLINLILISSWFLLILSFLRKQNQLSMRLKNIISIFGKPDLYIWCYFQPKYYQKTLYLVDFDLYICLFIFNYFKL